MTQRADAATLRSLRTTPRWVKWALGLSLFANLVIVGVVVGAVAKHHKGGHDLGAMTMRMALHKMSDSSRAEAEQAIAVNRAAMRTARRANAEARARLAAVVAAQPFDAEAAEAAFADILVAHTERRRLLHENFISILGAMTEEERAEAAEHLERWERWRQRKSRED